MIFQKGDLDRPIFANCQYFSRWQDLVRYAVENLMYSFAMLFKVIFFQGTHAGRPLNSGIPWQISLISGIQDWMAKYPFVSIEDPFDQARVFGVLCVLVLGGG